MSRSKRFLFHVLLWLAIWLMATFLVEENLRFLRVNGPSFLMQILVVAILIYYTAPKLLLKKKYLLFASTSLVLIVLCALAISNNSVGTFNAPPPPHNGPFRGNPGFPGPFQRPKEPPQFLIHFLIVGFAYILATFVETFLFAQKKEEETIRNKTESLQTELKFLKSQINPHFLFNTLNNIYALSATNTSKTQQGISSLSNMLRYVLYECDRPKVPIYKEVAYIENYLELFALKSSTPFPIETDFQIMQNDQVIAPMLLIPFVENALKHGNLEKRKNAFLRITLRSDESKIHFEVQNSIPQETVEKDSVGGIGLKNVRKRLAIMYPEKYKLFIKNEMDTFSVKLELDLDETH